MQPSSYDTFEKPRRLWMLRALVLVVVLVFSLGCVWLYRVLDKKVLTIDPGRGVTATLGVPGHSDIGPSIQKKILQTNTKTSIKLSKGWYVVEFKQAGRHSEYKYVDLKSNTNVSMPELPFLQSELTALLKSEEPAINVLLKEDPATSNYMPGYEQLYNLGDWFAAVLQPNTPNLVTQRVILHKEGDTWVVAAGPASSFYIKDYPSIPRNVIRDINNH